MFSSEPVKQNAFVTDAYRLALVLKSMYERGLVGMDGKMGDLNASHMLSDLFRGFLSLREQGMIVGEMNAFDITPALLGMCENVTSFYGHRNARNLSAVRSAKSGPDFHYFR